MLPGKELGLSRRISAFYDISQCRSTFIVGTEEPSKPPGGKFAIVGEIELEKIENNPYGYNNLFSVDHVIVRDTKRGERIGIQLYNFIVKSGIILMSDMSQYFGARRLWSRISKQTDIIVDVIDTQKQSIVAKDVELHQGVIDSDFDNEYWSYDIKDGKHNIRFVIRDIK